MVIRRILVPTDFSDHSRAASLLGLALARAHGATLMLFHADHLPGVGAGSTAPPGFPVQAWRRYREAQARSVHGLVETERDALRASAGSAPGVTVEIACREVEVTRGIRAQAHSWKADLIVMGSRGAHGELFGSVTAHVVREAPCPVIVTRANQPGLGSNAGFTRPLVAVDYSWLALPAIRLAAALAAPSATVCLLHVWQPPQLPHYEISPGLENPDLDAAIEASSVYLGRRLRELVLQADLHSLAVSYSVERGRIAPAILERAASEKNDVIVMGTHTPRPSDRIPATKPESSWAGQDPDPGFTGSTTARVLLRADIPIAVVS